MYNIDTLSQLSGLTRRTIRYYVQIGVLAPPEGGGRGSYYTDEHVKSLEKIQKWNSQGVPLMEMKRLLSGENPANIVMTGSRVKTWSTENYQFSDDIVLQVRAGRVSIEKIEAIREFITKLMNGEDNEQHKV